MKKEPIFIRKLTGQEKQDLERAKRSADACEMKRAQILLASSEGKTTIEINKQLGYSAEYARQMIHRFNRVGIDCLKRGDSTPLVQPRKILDEAKCVCLKEILHSSPREHAKANSVWTMTLVAEVLLEKGITPRKMSDEAIRQAVCRSGTSWKRAKDWVNSPDPQYALKKNSAID
jgi:transposase